MIEQNGPPTVGRCQTIGQGIAKEGATGQEQTINDESFFENTRREILATD
jgi:hypothetical protein